MENLTNTPAEQPLVSVLVPVYNVEKYLAQCLESICAQTYQNLEIICLNDGSTDSSPKILQEFAQRDPRIRIINKPNSGYGDSMNQGLDAARGKYIGIVESDDFIDPGMYEAYVNAAEAVGADIVKSNFYEYWQNRAAYYGASESESESDASADPANKKTDIFNVAGVPTGVVLRPRDLSLSFTLGPSIWSALYNRAFLERNGIRFATTPGAAFQDTSFSHLVMMCAECALFLNDAWLHYRVDSVGSSSNSPDKVFLVFGEFNRSFEYLRAMPLWGTEEGTRVAAALGAARMASYMWSYNRIAPRFKLQYALRWRHDLFELNREGLIDFNLLREDSRALLELLADDPLGFVARCNEQPDWFYYVYQPYEEWQLPESLPRRAYHAARHAAGRALRASWRSAKRIAMRAGAPLRGESYGPVGAEAAPELPDALNIDFVSCLPLERDVMWRVAVVSPDVKSPIELRVFDGKGTDLAVEPIEFENQLIEGASTQSAQPERVRRITYSLRLPREVASFGITAQQGEDVFHFFLDEAVVARQINTMTQLRRNAWDQEAYSRWLVSHPTRPVDQSNQPSFPVVVNDTHVAITSANVLVDPDCLEAIGEVLREMPEAVALYTDHDTISSDGRRTLPQFKPSFSPDYLRATNYLGDFLVVRKDLFDPELSAWELALKAADVALETDAPFIHVPRILWHQPEGEDVNTSFQKAPAQAASKSKSEVGDQPGVDIIIPNRDHADVLENCVKSILNKATYQNVTINIVENGSTQPDTFVLYEKLCKSNSRVRVITFEAAGAAGKSSEFNYSRLINFGVANTANPYLLLLNNDTEVIEPDFIQLLLEPVVRTRGGVSGGKLLFRDGLVQHVGMLIGPDDTVVHATQDVEPDFPGYMERNVLTSNVSAVTGACQMVSRATFDEVGGYSEEFAVGFNDADFCCKVRETGRFITVVPDALLYHFEFTSRGREASDPSKIQRWQREHDLFRSRWSKYFENGDPFRNLNLSRDSKAFGL